MRVEAVVAYFNVRVSRSDGDVHRTVEIGSMLVDLDESGRVLGIETLGSTEPNWLMLLMDDRLRFM